MQFNAVRNILNLFVFTLIACLVKPLFGLGSLTDNKSETALRSSRSEDPRSLEALIQHLMKVGDVPGIEDYLSGATSGLFS